MKTCSPLLVLATLSAMAFGEPAQPRDEWHRGLKLEDAARRAELIVAVRVEDVKEILVVRGGKGESATFQFRFKPLRTLKGVFARPELILGSADLGWGVMGDLKFMKAVQTRLMFLARSEAGYQNCNQNERSLDLTFPPLAREDDQLLQSVNTLLAVNAETNRFQCVKLLSAALEKASGASAEPLLAAMSPLALLAAQVPEATLAILRHLADNSPAVRSAAAVALKKVLEADYLEQPGLREKAGAALALAWAKEGPRIDARTAIIDACGSLGVIPNPSLMERLDFTRPANSIQERTAKARAVGMLKTYLTDKAVAALAAMHDPRTLDEAKKIFETSNDARWNAAAIRILGAIGAKEFAPKFLSLAAERKNPLAPSALIALGDLGEARALPLIRDALNARGADLADAGAEAAARLLKNPDIKGEEIRDLLAALLAGDDAPETVRSAALTALLELNDPRLDKALVSAVSDAMIDSSVLSEIEAALRARKVKMR